MPRPSLNYCWNVINLFITFAMIQHVLTVSCEYFVLLKQFFTLIQILKLDLMEGRINFDGVF